MVFLETPKLLAISSIVTLLNPRFKNKSLDMSNIFSLISKDANLQKETLETKKVSKVLNIF